MAHYKRIIKKEDVKGPDEFLSFWEHAYFWVVEKKEKLILPVIGFGVAVALVAGFFYYRQQKEVAANRELFNILKELPRQGGAKAVSTDQAVDNLKAFGEKFGATRSGKMGQLYRANILYQKKNFDDAAKAYREVMDGGSDLTAHLACMGLAASLQEQGKYADAVAALDKFRADSVFAEDMDYMAARTLEMAGNMEAAAKEYTKFMEKHSASRLSDDVRERSSRLL
ncbi:MAG: tetratricopeptide repeat protein [Nitrospinae bacterium]|nr:tetratricopeptide repeat protein [Nitrospinota bacterium]